MAKKGTVTSGGSRQPGEKHRDLVDRIVDEEVTQKRDAGAAGKN